MRITKQTRFAHPVLSSETQDYKEGGFSVKLKVKESRSTGKISVEYDAEVTEPSIKQLLIDGKASLHLFVVCLRTYFNELKEINLDTGEIEFTKGELRGTVVFRPIVCAKENIPDHPPTNLHSEFSSIAWSFKKADVLALGEESTYEVGLDKLAPIETIFNLVMKPEIEPGMTAIILDEDKISICADQKTHDGIHRMRNTQDGKLALLNAVYLPAVIAVLTGIKDSGQNAYQDLQWFSVFSAKCVSLGINLENTNPHIDAQKLLQAPLGFLLKSKTFKAS